MTESTRHPLSTFYPKIEPDMLDMFSSFTEATFGQEPDPTQFSTRAAFEKGVLSEVEDELHKAPLTEETIEKCAFFVFSFFFDLTPSNYHNMYDIAAQVRSLSALLHVLPRRAPDWKGKSHILTAPPYGRSFLFKWSHNSAWYGIPEKRERDREELFFLIDQKFLQGNVVPPSYRCHFQHLPPGTLHRYVSHTPLAKALKRDRSPWDAPQVRMNALLHLLVNFMDESNENYGVKKNTPLRLASFDGESILSPNLIAGPRRTPLLEIPATSAILDDPFSPEEMEMIDAIDDDQLKSFLLERNIEEKAIFIVGCTLQVLRLAISRQREGEEDQISLRDLIVIANISDPFELTADDMLYYYPGKNTLFYTICQESNTEDRTRAVFATIIEIKKQVEDTPVDELNPYMFSENLEDRVIKPYVWDYYRKFKVKPSQLIETYGNNKALPFNLLS